MSSSIPSFSGGHPAASGSGAGMGVNSEDMDEGEEEVEEDLRAYKAKVTEVRNRERTWL